MKLKRGFTLVELLAVIAILALLVVFALPSVLEMYNRAKKELFLTEAKTVYKEVSKKYISENMRGNKLTSISSKGNKLDLEVNGLTYNVRLNTKGKVKFFYVSNGTYCLSGKYDNLNKLTIDEVKDKDCDNDNYVPPVIYCNFSGNMVQGAEFKKGPYTYRYKQDVLSSRWSDDMEWNDITEDGWGVVLTDKASTDAVTGELCTYINNKPIVSMSGMFAHSNASSIDFSSFNTENVLDMRDMFFGTVTDILDLSNFDTSNVRNMNGMFAHNEATTINLSSFDTSSVTLMGCMFVDSSASSLDLTSFDTSNVTDMHNMFYGTLATSLDLKKFKTSNVTSMWWMFGNSSASVLDLSSFEINDSTGIDFMFENAKATTGYAKNAEIAALLNDASKTEIPSTLKFVVK